MAHKTSEIVVPASVFVTGSAESQYCEGICDGRAALVRTFLVPKGCPGQKVLGDVTEAMKPFNGISGVARYLGCSILEHDSAEYVAIAYERQPSAPMRCVQEYVHAFSDQGPDEPLISQLLEGVTTVLAAIHAAGAVHGAVRGANVWIQLPVGSSEPTGGVESATSDCVRLLGYGLSAWQLSSNSVSTEPFWTAPELLTPATQASKGSCDYPPSTAASDVWSLGILCVEIAEGAPPYQHWGPRVVSVIRDVAPPTLPTKWTLSFRSFVSRCLLKDPAQRAPAKALLEHTFLRPRDGAAGTKAPPLLKRTPSLVRQLSGSQKGRGTPRGRGTQEHLPSCTKTILLPALRALQEAPLAGSTVTASGLMSPRRSSEQDALAALAATLLEVDALVDHSWSAEWITAMLTLWSRSDEKEWSRTPRGSDASVHGPPQPQLPSASECESYEYAKFVTLARGTLHRFE